MVRFSKRGILNHNEAAKKTLLNFDLSLYRKVVYEACNDMGVSKKEIDQELLALLEKHKDELKTKVPCLTCGVNFSLNNLQHECKEEDIWLFNYVKNSQSKNLYKKHASKLKKKYPLLKENIAFRGINFKTKRHYEKFVKEVKTTGKYNFEDISSWSLDYSYAKRFARFTQKGSIANDQIRKKEIIKMTNENSNITGYKGVILGINLQREIVLCDISREYIGGLNEQEVILLPGTYPVTVVEVIDKKLHKWNKEHVLQGISGM